MEQFPGHLLAVLPGDVSQAVAHHVDDAELHLGPGIHRLYGLRKAGKEVEPELCLFVRLDPQAQQFFVAGKVDA